MSNSPFRAAVVQAASDPAGSAASAAKAARLIVEAGAAGARLAVFPEAFIGGYPREHGLARRSGCGCRKDARLMRGTMPHP
ncbi:nitrilase-related carbon-nitrogen hydrolase [Novosphingobium sp.]|uniref:nitrilase-related carbon-nitrogen hydrolase n=1 Tax=Novosphingobium sp. TaxID=1874826 RepID=UPI0025F72BFA|nr:nitrilase-related carbon-nitrogen hydrolase [Novosphingobium sp.]